jgi:RHS repeat-associated protein
MGDIVMEPHALVPLPPPNNIVQGEMTVLVGQGGGAGSVETEGGAGQCEADPVDVASGRVMTWAKDFHQVSPARLVFRRFYSSDRPDIGPLGVGWLHSLDISLTEQNGALLFRNEWGALFTLPTPTSATVEVGSFRVEPLPSGYLIWRTASDALEFTRDSLGGLLLTAVHDGNGRKTQLFYDDGLLIAVRNHCYHTLELEYSNGLLTRLVEVSNKSSSIRRTAARYEYDSSRRLVTVFNGLDQPVRYAYDDRLLVKHTNRNGFSYYFTYDSSGRCARAFGDGGFFARAFRYDPERGITHVVDSRGFSRIYFHTAGLTTRVEHPDGSKECFFFDERGSCIVEQDEVGAETQFLRDERGRLSKLVTPLGDVTAFEYDKRDRIVSRRSSDGVHWTYRYDTQGRLLSAESPPGTTWSFEHDEHGNLLRAVRPDGASLRYRYNEINEPTEIRDGAGASFRLSYDLFGNLGAVSDDLGEIARYEYDAAGRVILISDRAGGNRYYSYDAESNLVEWRDRSGRGQRYARYYNSVARVDYIEPSDPVPPPASYEYDPELNLISIGLPNGGVVRYEYDCRNRVARRIHADGRQTHFSYDAAGNVTEMRMGPHIVRCKYDLAHNLVEKTSPNGERIVYDYGSFSRVTRAQYGSHLNELFYDARGKLIREVADDLEIRYEYTPSGQRVSILPSIGEAIRYQWSPEHGVTEVFAGDHGRVRLDLDVRGRLKGLQYGNGIVESRELDHRDRLVAQNLGVGGDTTLFHREYRYDPESLLAARTDSRRGTIRFRSGARGKTVYQESEDPLIATGPFQYDSAGNLSRHPVHGSAEYDVSSRLTGTRHYRYEYDDAGRPVERVFSDGTRARFFYDCNDQIIRIEHVDGSVTRYEYDAFGRRVAKEHDGRRERWLWDGHFPLVIWRVGERPSTSQFVFDYRRVAPLMQIESGPQPEVRVYYCHTDHLGSVTDLTGEHGELAWSAEYDALGQAAIRHGDPNLTMLRRPGQYFDCETGLYYNRYRYYDPEFGRFTTPDPLGLLPALNPYAYPDNVSRTVDLSGLSLIFLDNNFLNALRNGDTSAVEFAEANSGNMRVSPAAYDEFIGADVSPSSPYNHEKRKLLDQYGIKRPGSLCVNAVRRFQKIRQDLINSGVQHGPQPGGENSHDADICAYAAVHDAPLLTQDAQLIQSAEAAGASVLQELPNGFKLIAF